MCKILLKETPWETRNLGTPSYEIDTQVMASEPDEDRLRSELSRLQTAHPSFFVHGRIQKNLLHLASLLGACGFYVVECAICPYIKLPANEALLDFERSPEAFLPAEYRNNRAKVLTITNRKDLPLDEIKVISREAFTDDRFHLDYNCSKETADSRFAYWVDDLIAAPEVVFDLLLIEDSVAGFMARKRNNLILTGFYGKYKKPGLEEFLWLSSCLKLKEQDFLTAETLISANNLAVLNLYARLGFTFKETQYSFHYWYK